MEVEEKETLGPRGGEGGGRSLVEVEEKETLGSQSGGGGVCCFE